MSKATPTRTTNPIHFEDLDPKRFEDLVRELIYDFRDWLTIEATGKGGDDDGFDIRAYERTTTTTVDDDGNEVIRPMDGNIWMIQCKREKAVPPSKIKKILEDIDPDNPPYGYILAAATNFSKKSYDTFREKLTELGVLEFYLWGNATLETELHQPKNDRILFTFFGISNVRRKRSRATEIRSEVSNKNKVMRALGERIAGSWIFARDSKDYHYPNRSKYPDFDKNPRWKDYEVVKLHPRGVIVSIRQCYAFFDEEKSTYDVAEPPIVKQNPQHGFVDDREGRAQLDKVRDYWERLPRDNQAMFYVQGIIRFEDMLVIDDKGDAWNKVPHIFVDFENHTPISKTLSFLKQHDFDFMIGGLSRENVFPAVFPEPSFGTIYDEEALALPDHINEQFASYRGRPETLFDVDGLFDHLQPGDVAVIRSSKKDDRFIQITHRYQLAGGDLIDDYPQWAWQVQQQIGREVTKEDLIHVLEFRDCYEHQWKE